METQGVRKSRAGRSSRGERQSRIATFDEEEEEAAAKDDEDDDGDLVIATALRGAVVDAAALDRARAWSMLLEDISRWKSSARACERERESVRYS